MRHRSGGERPFGLRGLDLDHFAKPVHGFDGVVERDCPVRRNELGDLEVVAAPFRPHQRRHAKASAAYRLLVLPSQGCEVGGLEVSLPASDIEAGALGRDAMGWVLVDWKMVFVAGARARKTGNVSPV